MSESQEWRLKDTWRAQRSTQSRENINFNEHISYLALIALKHFINLDLREHVGGIRVIVNNALSRFTRIPTNDQKSPIPLT